MEEKKFKFSVQFNSPVVLSFSIISLISLILGYLTSGGSDKLLFSVYRSSLLNPLTYIRLIGHTLGHANLEHYMGNIMLILVIGPLLEEKYGSKDLLFVIISTAVITGIVHMIFFPNVMLLGASGVVFAFILLASFTNFKEGYIPLTFILVFLLYIGQQIINGIFVQDNISNLTHIVGGIVGSFCGYWGRDKGSSN